MLCGTLFSCSMQSDDITLTFTHWNFSSKNLLMSFSENNEKLRVFNLLNKIS